MRKTKIVCTIGPASESISKLEKLIKEGMDVARLNFSHGDFSEHNERITRIRQAAEQSKRNIGILLDIKGPEIRTHQVENGEITLQKNSKLIIAMEQLIGTNRKISVTYENLIDDISVGAKILLDDGLIELEATEIDFANREIVTKVLNDGILTNNKGVNVPGVSVKLPGLTEKDREDILFGIEKGVDFIAASFVRKAADVFEIRRLLEENNGANIHIIAKIENEEGVRNIDKILQAADGLMVARGDLGVEIPAEEVPLVQKSLIRKANYYGKPVITATQMLDSMQRNPRPTRAEASDVANAIIDGTDAVMLSGETAAGLYPLESVRTMNNIALRTEESIDPKISLNKLLQSSDYNMTEAIGQSVANTAYNLKANAIITPTESGHTARMIAKYRPRAPIVAVTGNQIVSQQLSLTWGVYPQTGKQRLTTDEMLDSAIKDSLKTPYVKHGDLVVITAGVPINETGTTNLMKIHVVGDIVAKAQGIGRTSAYGKVVLAKDAAEAIEKVTPGVILVTPNSDKAMMPALEKCAGLITVEGGLTSHGAVVGLSLGIPVIVGLDDALTVLKEGEEITVDANSGTIYKGHASVL